MELEGKLHQTKGHKPLFSKAFVRQRSRYCTGDLDLLNSLHIFHICRASQVLTNSMGNDRFLCWHSELHYTVNTVQKHVSNSQRAAKEVKHILWVHYYITHDTHNDNLNVNVYLFWWKNAINHVKLIQIYSYILYMSEVFIF